MPMATGESALHDILSTYRRVAVVGLSAKPNRPSNEVATYLIRHGYDVLAVNPTISGERVLGLEVYASLLDLPEPPEIVDVFRRSEFVADVAEQAIAVGAKVLWTQLGVRDDAAARRASEAGLVVVQDRCMAVEHARLGIGGR